MGRTIKSAKDFTFVGAMAIALSSGAASAQVLKGSVTERSAQFRWHVNQRLVQSLGQNARPGAKAGAPGGMADGSNPAIIAVLRQQSSAARSLVAASSGGSTRADELNPQPLPPRGSAPQIGPGQTMSSPGKPNLSSVPQARASSPQTGPVRHQNPGADRAPQPAAVRAPAPTQFCMNGIATVDGKKSGVVFMPIAGPEGTFVIQGCGFGAKPGEVYLSGLQYPPSSPTGRRIIRMFPDRLSLQIAQNGFTGGQPGQGNWQLGWSDRQIVVRMDPNASGFFDTNNVALVVKTASGQEYKAAGFRFFAAREQRKLASIPTRAITPGQSYDTAGHATVANILSPSAASVVLPGHTVAVVREDNSAPFPGGADTLDLSRSLPPGFQVIGVQQFNAALTSAACQSIPPGGGHFTTNGTWNVTATGGGAYMILWQEQSCATQSTSGPNVSSGSISAYALDITVTGPRGVDPSVSTGTLEIVN